MLSRRSKASSPACPRPVAQVAPPHYLFERTSSSATYKAFGLAGHEGVDFFAPTGAKIYASFDGMVT